LEEECPTNHFTQPHAPLLIVNDGYDYVSSYFTITKGINFYTIHKYDLTC